MGTTTRRISSFVSTKVADYEWNPEMHSNGLRRITTPLAPAPFRVSRNLAISPVRLSQQLIKSFIDHPGIISGDARVNQNPQLALLQIVLLREHNRIADALAALNPHWDDETIFQEARRIAIAEHQYISYYEWLPIFIGLQNSLSNKILYATPGFVNDYRSDVNPTVLNEHATAAFRYFHSLIAGHLE